MKRLKFLRKESGAYTVMAALLMSLVVAFLALSIDVGYHYYRGAKLQNAADAAATAVAGNVGTIDTQYDDIAYEYLEKNGFSNEGADAENPKITCKVTAKGKTVVETADTEDYLEAGYYKVDVWAEDNTLLGGIFALFPDNPGDFNGPHSAINVLRFHKTAYAKADVNYVTIPKALSYTVFAATTKGTNSNPACAINGKTGTVINTVGDFLGTSINFINNWVVKPLQSITFNIDLSTPIWDWFGVDTNKANNFTAKMNTSKLTTSGDVHSNSNINIKIASINANRIQDTDFKHTFSASQLADMFNLIPVEDIVPTFDDYGQVTFDAVKTIDFQSPDGYSLTGENNSINTYHYVQNQQYLELTQMAMRIIDIVDFSKITTVDKFPELYRDAAKLYLKNKITTEYQANTITYMAGAYDGDYDASKDLYGGTPVLTCTKENDKFVFNLSNQANIVYSVSAAQANRALQTTREQGIGKMLFGTIEGVNGTYNKGIGIVGNDILYRSGTVTLTGLEGNPVSKIPYYSQQDASNNYKTAGDSYDSLGSFSNGAVYYQTNDNGEYEYNSETGDLIETAKINVTGNVVNREYQALAPNGITVADATESGANFAVARTFIEDSDYIETPNLKPYFTRQINKSIKNATKTREKINDNSAGQSTIRRAARERTNTLNQYLGKACSNPNCYKNKAQEERYSITDDLKVSVYNASTGKETEQDAVIVCNGCEHVKPDNVTESNGTWICPDCGVRNSTTEGVSWKCPGCGTVNTVYTYLDKKYEDSNSYLNETDINSKRGGSTLFKTFKQSSTSALTQLGRTNDGDSVTTYTSQYKSAKDGASTNYSVSISEDSFKGYNLYKDNGDSVRTLKGPNDFNNEFKQKHLVYSGSNDTETKYAKAAIDQYKDLLLNKFGYTDSSNNTTINPVLHKKQELKSQYATSTTEAKSYTKVQNDLESEIKNISKPDITDGGGNHFDQKVNVDDSNYQSPNDIFLGTRSSTNFSNANPSGNGTVNNAYNNGMNYTIPTNSTSISVSNISPTVSDSLSVTEPSLSVANPSLSVTEPSPSVTATIASSNKAHGYFSSGIGTLSADSMISTIDTNKSFSWTSLGFTYSCGHSDDKLIDTSNVVTERNGLTDDSEDKTNNGAYYRIWRASDGEKKCGKVHWSKPTMSYSSGDRYIQEAGYSFKRGFLVSSDYYFYSTNYLRTGTDSSYQNALLVKGVCMIGGGSTVQSTRENSYYGTLVSASGVDVLQNGFLAVKGNGTQSSTNVAVYCYYDLTLSSNSFMIVDGNMHIGGEIKVQPGAVLVVNNGSISAGTDIINNGTIICTGDVYAGGSITNNGNMKVGSISGSTAITNQSEKVLISTGAITSSGAITNNSIIKIGQNSESKSITASGSITNAANCTMYCPGSVTSSGAITNSGNFRAASITSSTEITNNADRIFVVTGGINATTSITNKGSMQAASISGGCSITNDTNRILYISGSISAGAIINGGSMNASTITGSSSITNNANSTLVIGGSITSSGAITNNGNIKIGQNSDSKSITSSGSVTNGTNCIMYLPGSVTSSGAISNSGSFRTTKITSCTDITNNANCTFIVTGDISSTGTITNNGGMHVGSVSSATGGITNGTSSATRTFISDGKVEKTGAITNYGNFKASSVSSTSNITSNGTFLCAMANNTTLGSLSADGTITNTGSMKASSISKSGAITNNANSTINTTNSIKSTGVITNNNSMRVASINGCSGIVNSGTIYCANSSNTIGAITSSGYVTNNNNAKIKCTTLTADGKITNGSGAIIDVSSITYSSGTSGDLDNSGKIYSADISRSGNSVNSGEINNDGVLACGGYFNNTGTYLGDEDRGNTLSVTVGGYLSNSGTFKTKGKITVTGTDSSSNSLLVSGSGVLYCPGDMNLAGKLNMNGGTIYIMGTVIACKTAGDNVLESTGNSNVYINGGLTSTNTGKHVWLHDGGTTTLSVLGNGYPTDIFGGKVSEFSAAQSCELYFGSCMKLTDSNSNSYIGGNMIVYGDVDFGDAPYIKFYGTGLSFIRHVTDGYSTTEDPAYYNGNFKATKAKLVLEGDSTNQTGPTLFVEGEIRVKEIEIKSYSNIHSTDIFKATDGGTVTDHSIFESLGGYDGDITNDDSSLINSTIKLDFNGGAVSIKVPLDGYIVDGSFVGDGSTAASLLIYGESNSQRSNIRINGNLFIDGNIDLRFVNLYVTGHLYCSGEIKLFHSNLFVEYGIGKGVDDDTNRTPTKIELTAGSLLLSRNDISTAFQNLNIALQGNESNNTITGYINNFLSYLRNHLFKSIVASLIKVLDDDHSSLSSYTDISDVYCKGLITASGGSRLLVDGTLAGTDFSATGEETEVCGLNALNLSGNTGRFTVNTGTTDESKQALLFGGKHSANASSTELVINGLFYFGGNKITTPKVDIATDNYGVDNGSCFGRAVMLGGVDANSWYWVHKGGTLYQGGKTKISNCYITNDGNMYLVGGIDYTAAQRRGRLLVNKPNWSTDNADIDNTCDINFGVGSESYFGQNYKSDGSDDTKFTFESHYEPHGDVYFENSLEVKEYLWKGRREEDFPGYGKRKTTEYDCNHKELSTTVCSDNEIKNRGISILITDGMTYVNGDVDTTDRNVIYIKGENSHYGSDADFRGGSGMFVVGNYECNSTIFNYGNMIVLGSLKMPDVQNAEDITDCQNCSGEHRKEGYSLINGKEDDEQGNKACFFVGKADTSRTDTDEKDALGKNQLTFVGKVWNFGTAYIDTSLNVWGYVKDNIVGYDNDVWAWRNFPGAQVHVSGSVQLNSNMLLNDFPRWQNASNHTIQRDTVFACNGDLTYGNCLYNGGTVVAEGYVGNYEIQKNSDEADYLEYFTTVNNNKKDNGNHQYRSNYHYSFMNGVLRVPNLYDGYYGNINEHAQFYCGKDFVSGGITTSKFNDIKNSLQKGNDEAARLANKATLYEQMEIAGLSGSAFNAGTIHCQRDFKIFCNSKLTSLDDLDWSKIITNFSEFWGSLSHNDNSRSYFRTAMWFMNNSNAFIGGDCLGAAGNVFGEDTIFMVGGDFISKRCAKFGINIYADHDGNLGNYLDYYSAVPDNPISSQFNYSSAYVYVGGDMFINTIGSTTTSFTLKTAVSTLGSVGQWLVEKLGLATFPKNCTRDMDVYANTNMFVGGWLYANSKVNVKESCNIMVAGYGNGFYKSNSNGSVALSGGNAVIEPAIYAASGDLKVPEKEQNKRAINTQLTDCYSDYLAETSANKNKHICKFYVYQSLDIMPSSSLIVNGGTLVNETAKVRDMTKFYTYGNFTCGKYVEVGKALDDQDHTYVLTTDSNNKEVIRKIDGKTFLSPDDQARLNAYPATSILNGETLTREQRFVQEYTFDNSAYMFVNGDFASGADMNTGGTFSWLDSAIKWLQNNLLSTGYTKVYASSALKVNGNIISNRYITLRHDAKIYCRGDMEAATSIEGGTYSEFYIGGNMTSASSLMTQALDSLDIFNIQKEPRGRISLYDQSRCVVGGEMYSTSQIEIGATQDSKGNDYYKRGRKTSFTVGEGRDDYYLTPDMDDYSESVIITYNTDTGKYYDENGKELKIDGTKMVYADGTGTFSESLTILKILHTDDGKYYRFGDNNAQLPDEDYSQQEGSTADETNDSTVQRGGDANDGLATTDEDAYGSEVFVGGSMIGLNGHIKEYAYTCSVVGNYVYAPDYITLRSNADLWVLPETFGNETYDFSPYSVTCPDCGTTFAPNKDSDGNPTEVVNGQTYTCPNCGKNVLYNEDDGIFTKVWKHFKEYVSKFAYNLGENVRFKSGSVYTFGSITVNKNASLMGTEDLLQLGAITHANSSSQTSTFEQQLSSLVTAFIPRKVVLREDSLVLFGKDISIMSSPVSISMDFIKGNESYAGFDSKGSANYYMYTCPNQSCKHKNYMTTKQTSNFKCEACGTTIQAYKSGTDNEPNAVVTKGYTYTCPNPNATEHGGLSYTLTFKEPKTADFECPVCGANIKHNSYRVGQLSHPAVVYAGNNLAISTIVDMLMTYLIADQGSLSLYNFYTKNAYDNANLKELPNAMCSYNGDINYTAWVGQLSSLFYAPMGNVDFDGFYTDIYGSVIGNTVSMNAFYQNFHRFNNWRTMDLHIAESGNVYLIPKQEFDNAPQLGGVYDLTSDSKYKNSPYGVQIFF